MSVRDIILDKVKERLCEVLHDESLRKNLSSMIKVTQFLKLLTWINFY